MPFPMQPSNFPAKRVHGLDILRALAITMVLVTHSKGLLVPWFPQLKHCAVFGYLGVELFFVLSGFLIGRILIRIFSVQERVPVSRLFRFWIRRWFRTLPNYYLVLVVVIALAFWYGHTGPGWRYFLFLQNLQSPHPPIFGEAWSLAVEEWFYLTTPLLFWAVAAAFPLIPAKRRILGVIVGVACISLGARIFHVYAHNPLWDAGVRKVVIFRLDAIMAGVFQAWLVTWYPCFTRRHDALFFRWGLFLLVFTVAGYFGLDKDTSVYARTLYFTVTSVGFSLLLPLCSRIPHPGTLQARLITQISLISYSIYLLHLSIIQFLLFQYIPRDTPGQAVGAYILYWGLCLVLPYPVYRWYEVPTMKLRNHFFKVR